MGKSSGKFRSHKNSIKNVGMVYYAAAAALMGLPVIAVAGTSTNTVGPIQAGTSDGSTNNSKNNPAVTISFSGQTALRAFDTSPGITLLNPGTSIILHTGTNGAPVTYTAPLIGLGGDGQPDGTGVTVQLGSSAFSQSDFQIDSSGNQSNLTPGVTSTDPIQVQSAIRLEWHEQGSIDGEYDLINDQVGFTNSTPISVAAQRGASVANPTWINTTSFSTSATSTTNGFTFNGSSAANPANTYDSSTYTLATGVNNAQGQNRIQFSVGEYRTEGLSVPLDSTGNATTPSLTAKAGTNGYGLGNPALRSASTLTGLGVGGVRQQFQPQSIVNESTNKVDPQTGQDYTTGPWNTAGSSNIDSTPFAVTAVGFSANPGTGLTHLNLADTQWLQTTGRLQNGAVFNYVSRTVDTGQRVVAALNTGIDPTWAVGSNDDGNSTATTANPNAATQQHDIGPSLRFSGKTSGTEAQKTISSNRLAVGALSITETRGATNSTPVRLLSVDFNSGDYTTPASSSFTTDPSTFISINYNTIISDGVTPLNYSGGAGVVYPHYPAVLISHFNTIKAPNASYNTASGTTWAAAKSFDPSTAELDETNYNYSSGGATAFTGIKGDPTGDVAAFTSNIINSSGVGFNTSNNSYTFNKSGTNLTSLDNPADNLYNNGYLIPALLDYTRQNDGGAIVSNASNISSSKLTLQNNVYNSYGSLFTADNTPGSSDQTIGSGATYGAVGAQSSSGSTSAINGTIAITAKSFDGVNTWSNVANKTIAAGGNYLFGNFNQNGVRDYSAVLESVNAALSLYAVDQSENSIFTTDGGKANSTPIPSLVGSPGWSNGASGTIVNATNTKGDLITLGDYNGDGKFDGEDLYQLAIGASLATNTSSNTLVGATASTFADAVRNPNDVLRKNSALDYFNNYLTYTGSANATGGVLFLRKTGRAVLSAPSIPAGAVAVTDLHTGLAQSDPITGQPLFTYDPNGTYAFDKHDVNRDGVVDFNDALLVDQFNGQSYLNLTQQLAATDQAPVTGLVQSIDLAVVQQIDGESAIGSADLTELNTGLTGTGNTNWYAFTLTKSGPGTIAWARTGGTVTVYPGAALQISSGRITVSSAIDPFTDSSITGTNTSTGSSLPVLVTSGATLEYSAQSSSAIQLDRLASLNISSGGLVKFDPSAAGHRSLLLTGSLALSTGAKLDLGNNDLDVQAGAGTSLSALTTAAAQGFANGTWNGSAGLTSTAAANNTSHLTALGVIQNNQSGTALFTAANTFDGITPGVSDLLARYTYFGDTNLDGKVDGSDYSRIDNGFLHQLTSWYNGDFNYDGVINGSDYTLIDNAFNTQGAALSAAIASPEASPEATPTEQLAGSPATAVPEPATTALIGLAATLGLLGRRRRQSIPNR
jgi:hypothetical protein